MLIQFCNSAASSPSSPFQVGLTRAGTEKLSLSKMMRRAAFRSLRGQVSAVVLAAPALSRRWGGGNNKVYDHSDAFSRRLTPEESIALEDQKHRTVSSVVPGKLFLRHWTAAEQSTVSIVNRVLSLLVTLGIFVWASGYAGLGLNGLNAWHCIVGVFLSCWLVLHTHEMWLIPAILGLAALQVLFN